MPVPAAGPPVVSAPYTPGVGGGTDLGLRTGVGSGWDLGFPLTARRLVRYPHRGGGLLPRLAGRPPHSCVLVVGEPAVHADAAYATPTVRARRHDRRSPDPQALTRRLARRLLLEELVVTAGGRDATGICALDWTESPLDDGVLVTLTGTPVHEPGIGPGAGLSTSHLSEPQLREAVRLGVRPRSTVLAEATATRHLTGDDDLAEHAEQVLAAALAAARAETERAPLGCGGSFVLVGPVRSRLERDACDGPGAPCDPGYDLRATVTVLATALSGRPAPRPTVDPTTVLPLSALAGTSSR